MTKVRIIKRTSPGGHTSYVIQQKHYLIRWLWVDAWCNSLDGAVCQDSFSTLEEAEANLWRFDGSKWEEEVVR